MTDEPMDEARFGERLRRVARRLEQTERVPDDARARAATQMRAAYHRGRNGSTATGRAGMPELIDLVANEPERRSHLTVAVGGLVAAAVALVSIGYVVGRSTPDRTPADQPTPSVDTPSTPPTTSPPAIPRSLAPGQYRTDALGPWASFTLTDSTQVTRLEPGLVELATGPEPDASTMTLSRPTKLSEHSAAISLADFFGERAGIQEQPDLIGGQPAVGWRWLDPTADGGCNDLNCTSIFQTPDVSIELGRTTDIFEVSIDGHDPIVIIVGSNPADFRLDYGGPFVDVIRSLQFDGSTDSAQNPTRSDLDPTLEPVTQ